MPAIYLYEHTVTPDEIDGQGHVNNLVYLKWMQTAAVEHSTAQGWPSARYRESKIGWVVRSHFIEYRQPAFLDEPIVVKTWVCNFRKVTSLRRYKIIRKTDDIVLAVAETEWAFLGLERRVPRRIPAELSGAFEVVPEDQEP